MEYTEKVCLECGRTFKSRQNLMCPECISKVIAESQPKPVEREDIRAELGYLPVYKPGKKKPQVVKDAIAAAKLGMSYGQYMADVKGKGKKRR